MAKSQKDFRRAAGITTIHRVVVAVGEHIVANETLSGRGEDVSINEPAHGGIIVTAVEVVEVGFLGTVVAKEEKTIL